jgi:hypothetical protein
MMLRLTQHVKFEGLQLSCTQLRLMIMPLEPNTLLLELVVSFSLRSEHISKLSR